MVTKIILGLSFSCLENHGMSWSLFPQINSWRRVSRIAFCVHHQFFSSVPIEGAEMPRANTIAWVQSIRRHKTKTFLNVNDGTSPNDLQVVCSTPNVPEGLSVGSAVYVEGQMVLHGHSHAPEVRAGSVRLLSPPVNAITAEASHIVGAMSHSRPRLGLLRSEHGLFWRHRLPEMGAMLRLRAACKSIVRRVLQTRGYLEVDTPILTTADCEGAGETFLVKSASTTEKDQVAAPLHLTVSAQLHLEALALGMSKVYTLSPTFRAEPSHSRLHLAEFLMLEAESVTMTTVDALCDEIESIVRDIASPYLDLLSTTSQNDLHHILSYLSETPGAVSPSEHLKTLQSVLSCPFTRMTFHEALDYLERHGKRNSTTNTEVSGFNKEEEQALCVTVGGGVFVTDFPAAQKPFYCAQSLTSKNTKPSVAAVDLLIPGVGELVGGSVRESQKEVLLTRMPGGETGALGWYANLRGHGGAPHGGFGLGFDRLLLWLLGVYNIRDTVTFPREIGKMYL
ncbi:asparaginyl tRNA synthetase [Echinococcus multilocularis]|uniref:Asparaginyl tRNA synthetase n=1 Tax=Echinococcus multilocularis TaxID=6211 RepID=A0A068Y9N4_ECHMU|nr:asparaginyl tRNA synthetase [Echinococcus multilocularis]